MNVGFFQQQTLLPWNSNQPLMVRREFNFWWHVLYLTTTGTITYFMSLKAFVFKRIDLFIH